MNVDLNNIDVTLVKTTRFNKLALNSSDFEPILDDLVLNIPLIKSQMGKSVSFAISAVSIGTQMLLVKANCSLAGDAERKTILVKPEGINQISNIPMLLDMRKVQHFNANIEISFPENLVENSEECSVQVIGDLLGQAFNNLGLHLYFVYLIFFSYNYKKVVKIIGLVIEY